jgi:hypothetical protein
MTRPAHRTFLAIAAAGLGLLAIAAAVSAAAPAPPAGDAGAIALEQQSRTAMGAYGAITFTGAGTSYRVIHQSGGDGFKFNFGAVPKGYRSAVAHVRIVQHKGLVTEEIDTLFAPGEPPLRLWQNRGTEIGELLGPRACPALVAVNAASFSTIGSPFVTVRGRYAVPVSAGIATVVSSSYALAGGTARERDTIDAATHLLRSSRFVIAGGPYSGEALGESDFAFSASRRFIAPPALRGCA